MVLLFWEKCDEWPKPAHLPTNQQPNCFPCTLGTKWLIRLIDSLLWLWVWCQRTTHWNRSPSKAATEWSSVQGCSSQMLEQKRMGSWGSFWCTRILFWVAARLSSMVTPLSPLTWEALPSPPASPKLRMLLLSATAFPTLSLFPGFCCLVLPQVCFILRSLTFLMSIYLLFNTSHPLFLPTYLTCIIKLLAYSFKFLLWKKVSFF